MAIKYSNIQLCVINVESKCTNVLTITGEDNKGDAEAGR